MVWGYPEFEMISEIVYPAGVFIFLLLSGLMALRYWQEDRNRNFLLHLIVAILLSLYCLLQSSGAFTSSISYSVAFRFLAVLTFGLVVISGGILVFLGFVKLYDKAGPKRGE